MEKDQELEGSLQPTQEDNTQPAPQPAPTEDGYSEKERISFSKGIEEGQRKASVEHQQELEDKNARIRELEGEVASAKTQTQQPSSSDINDRRFARIENRVTSMEIKDAVGGDSEKNKKVMDILKENPNLRIDQAVTLVDAETSEKPAQTPEASPVVPTPQPQSSQNQKVSLGESSIEDLSKASQAERDNALKESM